MENNESTQQQSSHLSNSKLARSSRRPTQLASLNSMLELIKHWPWLVWTGVWASLLAITAIAIFSLTYTGQGKKQEPEPTPVAAQNPGEAAYQTTSPQLLWLLGAVALTCAAGSLVFFKRRNNSTRPPRLRKRIKQCSNRGLTRRQQRKQQLQESPPVSTVLEPPPSVASVPAEIEPVVTLLPPEESHPLDSGEESLAEMMDIRKHRSLSSILGENFQESGIADQGSEVKSQEKR